MVLTNKLHITMPLLEVKNLKKYFATQKAVDDISLSIAPGQIFGLLGPNGAGKTTLIRMITGIFYPDSGSIIFDGSPSTPPTISPKLDTCLKNGAIQKNEDRRANPLPGTAKRIKQKEATDKIKQWFARFEMESWWNKKWKTFRKVCSKSCSL